MPRRTFRHVVQGFCEVIVAHGGDRHLETAHLFKLLSDAFNVAPLAVERRCQQLDFITEDVAHGAA